MIRKYLVTVRSAGPRCDEHTMEVSAYTAEDAEKQTEIQHKGCYPEKRVVRVEPKREPRRKPRMIRHR
jgi:hypothetical protein